MKLPIFVVFLALLACGGSKLILVSYPTSNDARSRLVAGAKSLGCTTADGKKDPSNLHVHSCKKYPDRTVLLLSQGEGWVASCSGADDDECQEMTGDLVSAAH